ncbi:MAG: aspartate ammonia-lyase [Verrucomicrobia bacterium]|nr:MAG: aspartate ammonia-lyase [Verrucomicrobiota bacterium]TAE86909.1 MAG: aspartate ammonia-lyase [Verrucomicrobiota bacterium]TAF24681.1 MAG: aspartate ammonia-lyase [Verrucomicrobiota bacterium]TAF40415.1 MAG: aspartate ammonia-lyase [Verrucomicrobiota bacterium]
MPKRPSSTTSKTSALLAGVAGEYFVAAELSRRGWIASISLRNTRGVDILATNSEATLSVSIQCKSTQGSKAAWILSDKSESFVSDSHFYVFVILGSRLERPHFHIVPSRDVAESICQDHSAWLRTPGRDGKAHVDNAIRKFEDKDGKYLERWDLLGLGG